MGVISHMISGMKCRIGIEPGSQRRFTRLGFLQKLFLCRWCMTCEMFSHVRLLLTFFGPRIHAEVHLDTGLILELEQFEEALAQRINFVHWLFPTRPNSDPITFASQ